MDDKLNQELQNLHQLALDCFAEADEGWQVLRQDALADLEFYNGSQWSESYLRQARLKKAPAITENRLPVFVSQVENSIRQQEMSITAGALDEAASTDTAEIFTGLIRAVEQDSRAKSQYIQAAGASGALVPGFGFLKVELEPTYPGSNQMKPIIKAARDPFKVICDPSWMEPDASDASYWFEFEDYTEKSFKRLFPKAQFTSINDFMIDGAATPEWLPGGSIRVARFWYKEEDVKIDYLLEDGTIVTDLVEEDKSASSKFEIDSENMLLVDTESGQSRPVLRNRQVLGCRIKWCDLTGAEILDEGDWIGDYMPFAMVPGTVSIVNGKKTVRGMIRFAKDSQVMLNYINVSMAKRLSSSNKAPWLLSPRHIKGDGIKKMWDAAANGEEFGYLLANDIDEKGNPITTPPIRADQTAQIQDLVVAGQAYEDKLKNTLGIYDAGLGATPNEQSGVAIQTLAQQGQNANYHFGDNLVRSLQQIGKILINLLPRVYDAPTAARIINAEGESKSVLLNALFQENGETKQYNLAEGVYGITVNVGPAHANQKQAAIQQMLELARVNPNITPFIQDLIAGAMDFPGKDLVAARLKKVLAITAPQVLENDGQPELPPEVMAQVAQMMQQLQQTTQMAEQLAAENQQLKNMIETKQVESQNRAELIVLENQAAMNMEQEKRQTQLTLAAVNNKASREDNEAERQMKMMQAALDEQRQTMQLILQTIKQFGPAADEVLANVMPSAVQTINSSGA